MTSSLDAAAQAMREAMRETVKRHSLWYLGQGGLMILTGILALVYPVISSVALVSLFGCLLILSGIVQGISLIDARNVPHFWFRRPKVIIQLDLYSQPICTPHMSLIRFRGKPENIC